MSLVDAFLLDPAPFEIWVAARADGIHGSGTNSDPFNGSTQERFDAVMKLFSSQSNVTIRLGPGKFETNGYADGETSEWQARPGMKIRGSGIDVTTLKLANLSTASDRHYFAVGHALTTAVDGFEISDLTIDANTAGADANSAFGGVRVMGNHARIHRVKVKNWGTRSANKPGFALSVITANVKDGIPEVASTGIEGCIAIDPFAGNAAVVTALNVGTQSDIAFTREAHGKSPYIRNCFIDCGVTTGHNPDAGKMRGISMSWCRGGVVEGNHVHNADVGGPYLDQRSVRDLIVRNNSYKNVARAVYLNLGQLGSELSSTASLSAINGFATISGEVDPIRWTTKHRI